MSVIDPLVGIEVIELDLAHDLTSLSAAISSLASEGHNPLVTIHAKVAEVALDVEVSTLHVVEVEGVRGHLREPAQHAVGPVEIPTLCQCSTVPHDWVQSGKVLASHCTTHGNSWVGGAPLHVGILHSSTGTREHGIGNRGRRDASAPDTEYSCSSCHTGNADHGSTTTHDSTADTGSNHFEGGGELVSVGHVLL